VIATKTGGMERVALGGEEDSARQ